MNSGVIRIQEISQNMLNGRPSTIGSTRSQMDTEKHTAVKGMSPRRIAVKDGFFTIAPFLIDNVGRIVLRNVKLKPTA
jgi:hypothetical protein